MSKYSNADNNLAQYTEGFEEGYASCNNELYELSDAEESENEVHVRFQEVTSVEGDVDEFDAPENTEDLYAENFTGDDAKQLVDGVRGKLGDLKDKTVSGSSYIYSLYKTHWKLVCLFVFVLVAIAFFYYDVIPVSSGNVYSNTTTSEFTLSTFSTQNSLGENIVKMFIGRM